MYLRLYDVRMNILRVAKVVEGTSVRCLSLSHESIRRKEIRLGYALTSRTDTLKQDFKNYIFERYKLIYNILARYHQVIYLLKSIASIIIT
jgi:hypothetical protein